MSNQMNTKYRACPKCTYPLRKMLLGYAQNKAGVECEVVRTYWSNHSCNYEKVMRRKKK